MKRLAILIFLSISLTSAAQTPELPLVQFTGVVWRADSNTVVPYATITNLSVKNQSYTANYKGYFSFVVREQDSIRITAIGYGTQIIFIPSGRNNKSYAVEIHLKQESINLPIVRIFPWASTDEFRKDFLSMKIADDDLEIAKKNISRKSILALTQSLARDGQEIHSNSFSDSHTNLVNQHSRTNPLLNPFAWGTLIRQITEGDKSRREEN
ncbi:MAG: hypothetical protein ACOH2A_00470 [Sphingobacteriaceae bacterium]